MSPALIPITAASAFSGSAPCPHQRPRPARLARRAISVKEPPKIFEIFLSSDLAELIGRVAEDRGEPAGIAIGVNERWSVDAVVALPTDRERGIGFPDVDRFALPVSSQPCGQLIGGVEQPGIAGFGGEQLTDGDDAAVMSGCPALDIVHLIGETKTLALHDPLARSTPDGFSTPSGPRGDCHGIVHPAVRRSAGLRLPLLRPHCHLRLPQRAIAARASGALLPPGGRRTDRRQRGPEATHGRLPGLGGRLRPAITGCRSNGPQRGCARKTMSCPGNAAWPATTPMASTSSSRAWSKERAFASPCRNTPPRIPITGSLPTSAAASPTTISTSAMRSSARW